MKSVHWYLVWIFTMLHNSKIFIPRSPTLSTQHGNEAQTEIDLKFNLLPKCPKPFWKNDEHVPACNLRVHMVRQHVTWLSHDQFISSKSSLLCRFWHVSNPAETRVKVLFRLFISCGNREIMYFRIMLKKTFGCVELQKMDNISARSWNYFGPKRVLLRSGCGCKKKIPTEA